ncbi:endoplasmic reticulum-Golgi intermediate compartment protein 3-like isoform X3 [Pomacea canaliculata]|nr:endoplasmic reticulum-Golgi intermediate compartment protein 3-like isoform X3 [Pomacea canaliculata]
MFTLFVSELNYYLTKEVHPELFVDTSRGQKLRINVDITFHHLPCAYLSVDAMDISGEQQIDLETNLLKQRLDSTGNPINETPQEQKIGEPTSVTNEITTEKLDPDRCESCYGAETDDKRCCNNCEDVREAYRKRGWAFNNPESIEQCKREGWSESMQAQKNEGCQAFGYLEVNKVAGNFHFAPGKSFQQHHVHVHDLQAFGGQKVSQQYFLMSKFSWSDCACETVLRNMGMVEKYFKIKIILGSITICSLVFYFFINQTPLICSSVCPTEGGLPKTGSAGKVLLQPYVPRGVTRNKLTKLNATYWTRAIYYIKSSINLTSREREVLFITYLGASSCKISTPFLTFPNPLQNQIPIP